MIEAITDHLAEKAPIILMMPFLVILALLVHELGHYVAARLASMKVDRVVIGFGKNLYSRTDKNGTQWFVRMWPFKAYVGIADFNAKKDNIAQRLFVVLAGPCASLILPFIIMSLFFAVFGKPVSPAIITGVEVDSPAYVAGVRPGDEIVAIDGQKIEYASQALPFTREITDRELSFEISTKDGARTLAIQPEIRRYRDESGFERAHGVIGVLMSQQPFGLKVLERVDGIELDGYDDDERQNVARDLIYERLGQKVVVGLKSNDRKIHEYLVALPRESNPNMMDKEHDEYEMFFIGRLRDNYYLPQTVSQSMIEAASRNIELIGNVAKVPFHLFPIDKEWILEDGNVSTRTEPVLFYVYRFVFLLSLLSVLIGLINLIPFPGLDGSVVLVDVAEAIKKGALTNKAKAYLICGALLLFYGSVLAANAPDMESYFAFLIEKVTGDA